MLSTGSNLQTQPPQGKPKIIATRAAPVKRGFGSAASASSNNCTGLGQPHFTTS
jgi:hypothetical protein